MQPLTGIKVLDFSTLLPGPLTTLMLAEAGAQVVKIERAGTGDDMRHYAPTIGGESVSFLLLNRGKSSLALDLKRAEDRARLDPLIIEADVLVEQFRPGVMDRLGLGHASLSAVNPRLIYCSITGYGQTGPKAQLAAHDLNYVTEAGMLALTAGAGGAPVVPAALVADIAAGAYPAVMNILLALLERERTGRGRHLDIAMHENLFPFLFWALGAGFGTGQWPGASDALLSGGSPRYNIYRTADDRFVAAAPIEEKFWLNFCEALNIPLDSGRETVATRIYEQPAAYWQRQFHGRDVCCSIVISLEEAVQDPHVSARGIFDRMIETQAGPIPALPVALVEAFRSTERLRRAPCLGES